MTPEQQDYTVDYMERNYPQGVAAVRADERERIAQAIEAEAREALRIAEAEYDMRQRVYYRREASMAGHCARIARAGGVPS